MSRELAEIRFHENAAGVYVPGELSVISGGQTPQVTEQDFLDGAAELNESWGIHKDPKSRQTCEIGVINADMAGNGIVLVAMTSNGGILINPGNAAEEIANAKANPKVARVIISDSGVGGTKAFRFRDLSHFSRTGRRTEGDGSKENPYAPQKSHLAIARILEDRELVPSYATSNVEAISYSLGVLAALDENTIKEIFANNPTGIAAKGNYARGMLTTDVRDRIGARTAEHDQWAITEELKQRTMELLPKIYKGSGHTALQASHIRLPYNQTFQVLARTGTRRKNLAAPDRHAILNDLLAVWSRHAAGITIQVNEDDKQNSVEGAVEFGCAALNSVLPEDRSAERYIRLLIGPGGKDRHTAKPHERWANERLALQSIVYQLFGRPGIQLPGTVQPSAVNELRRDAS